MKKQAAKPPPPPPQKAAVVSNNSNSKPQINNNKNNKAVTTKPVTRPQPPPNHGSTGSEKVASAHVHKDEHHQQKQQHSDPTTEITTAHQEATLTEDIHPHQQQSENHDATNDHENAGAYIAPIKVNIAAIIAEKKKNLLETPTSLLSMVDTTWTELVNKLEQESEQRKKTDSDSVNKEDNSLPEVVPKIGMRLEAVDLLNPQLITAAHIAKIDSDGKWLITFDGWDPQFDYWAEPTTATHLFPCGWMEYAYKAPGVFEELCQIRQEDMKPELQRPNGSNYPQKPFPWLEYFADLKGKTTDISGNVAIEAVPLNFFEKSHLLGFEQEHFITVSPDQEDDSEIAAIVAKPTDYFLAELIMKDLPQVHDYVFFWTKLAPSYFSTLEKLDISFCANITDLGIRWIADSFPSLKQLEVNGCRQVTERSLRVLPSKCHKLAAANFDMTSVRYFPTTLTNSETRFTLNHCQIILDEKTLPEGTKLPNDVPKGFTLATVLIVKPIEMAQIFVGKDIAPPDDDDIVGSSSFVCCYRCGHFRVIECVESSVVQLLLTENCLVVLPYSSNPSTTPVQEYESLSARFCLVASLVKSVKVVAVPINKGDSSFYAKIDEKLQASLKINLDEFQKCTNSNKRKTLGASSDIIMFPNSKHKTVLNYLFSTNFEMVGEMSQVLTWVEQNRPHADAPKSLQLLFHAFEKAKTSMKGSCFFNVDFLAQNLGKSFSNDVIRTCWSSFVSFLVETGNCWVESFATLTEGPLIGPRHCVTLLPDFVNFLNLFASNNVDRSGMTALSEEITCLAFDTPLLPVEKIKELIIGNSNCLNVDDFWRLMRHFECHGLAMFRKQSVLVMKNLRSEPPIPVEHFVAGASTNNAATIEIQYPLLCHPRTLFPGLLAALSRALPPTLLWRTGGFFNECSFLDVLVVYDDEVNMVVLILHVDKLATDNFDLLSGKATKLKTALKYSCSLIHTICCLVLSPFAEGDLTLLGKQHKFDFLPPNEVDHQIEPMNTASTFSRHFDPTIARCCKCLIDVNTIFTLQRFHLKEAPIAENVVVKPRGGNVQTSISLGEWQLSGSLGCSGFSPVSAEIMSVDGIENVIVYPGKDSADALKLVINSDGKLADYFVIDTATNKRKQQQQQETKPETAKPKSSGKSVAKQPQPPAVPNHHTPLLESGLRIEAKISSESTTTIGVGVSGLAIYEATFPSELTSNVVTVSIIRSSSGMKNQSEFPVFIRSAGKDSSTMNDGSSSTSDTAKIGMRLEAIDLIYPHLVAVARIADINAEGQWFIKFDGWGPRFDYWADPTVPHLFPCGWMEYAGRVPSVMQELCKVRQKNMTPQLQRPKNSNYSQSPFPWFKYFADLKLEAAANGEEDVVAEAVPLSFFEKGHLLGFDQDPLCNQYFKDARHSLSLSAFCLDNKKKLDEWTNYRSLVCLPMPEVDWSLITWPSRGKMTDPTITRPNVLCTWPDFIHFINESPTAKSMPPVSINAFHSLTMASALKKMLYQPRFIPNECDQLFDLIYNTECPYKYASMAMTNSGTANKAIYIENCLRQKLLPFILDYLTLVYPFNLMEYDSNMTTNVAMSFLEPYNRMLRAEDSKSSKWACVTVSPDKPQPRCLLINMQEAEGDFFLKHNDCPKLMCAQHAYHYSTFAKATEFGDVKLDWASSLSTMGNFHDEFMTLYALNQEDLRSLQQPINVLHPYTMGFVGFLSDAIEKSGLLTLRWLCELYLVRNELSSLPESFGNYENTLLRLDLSRNRFAEIPAVVYRLKSLEHLKMDYMSLVKLDDRISNLKNLKTLSLRQNCFKTLPQGLNELQKLEALDLAGLPSVPLSGNASSSLHIEEIAVFFENNNFPKDVADDLLIKFSEDEQITALDRATVERFNLFLFEKLPRLFVTEENETAFFPLQLDAFPTLVSLNLSNQPIVNVPDALGLMTSLKRLDFSGCLSLTSISPNITKCPLERLNLNDCPKLKTPPAEIRKRGLADIMNYFQRLSQGSVKCKRTKLMFVGLGGAGKTTLVHSLVSGDDKRVVKFDVTDGIDITNWQVEDIAFRMWDFAGQVVYYNTHQFFISNRAVYLLLWNIRLGHEHAGLDFWLSSIASHAPNAPILIVGTHADEVSQERSFLPELTYRTRFESICGFHYVSCPTNQGIAALKADIIRVTLAQKHIGEAVPVAWLKFEDELLAERFDEETEVETDVILLDKVQSIANNCGIYAMDEIDQALTFLSDMGSIQYFRTDFLSDRVIINPQWIVDVMAKVVSVKNTRHVEDGRLKHADIPEIWAAYPRAIHRWLLKLTEAFDLTFPLKKEPVSLVPCLLPENPPETLNFPSLEENPGHHQTKLVFAFKYLPTGLFNRVQTRLCQFSDGATMWRRGSLLRKNQHVALLSQPDSTSIQVKVQGPCPENIAFLILEVVDALIYESFTGVNPDYLFACPACVSSRAADPSIFERSRIRRAFELRIPFLQCFNYFHSVSTQELRQLFPAESSAEFETQFYRTMQEITTIQKTIKIDILVIGCSADANPVDLKNAVSTPEVGRDIEKSFPNLRVVVVADPDASNDAVSYDHLAVMMRTARVVVFCLSEQFMESDRCQAAFFTGRETLRKQVLMVVIREFDLLKYSALAFQMSDDIYVKAINRARYKSEDVAQRLSLRLEQMNRTVEAAANEPAQKKKPPVFISYCWQNSIDAVNRGSKSDAKALGVTDPREIKKFLSENGIDCWLDIEQIGLGGLFRDIADGIRNAQVAIVCVSDEYTRSENCLREFHFATTSCRRPIVLCPVGTGVDWQTSEVNLIVCQSATTINFQVNLKENYDNLLKAVKANMKSLASSDAEGAVQILSKLGRRKTAMNLNATSENTAAHKSLVLHEIIELGQRKMLRQLSGYAQAVDSRPYPRLLLLDAITSPDELAPPPVHPSIQESVNEKEGSESKPQDKTKEKCSKFDDEDDDDEGHEYRGEIVIDETEAGQAQQNANDPFVKLKWRVCFLCEHESGWHPTTTSLALNPPNNNKAANDVDAGQLFRQSAGYFGPMLTFLRQTANTSLELFAPKQTELSENCREVVAQIDQLVNPDQQTFQENYSTFRQFVMQLDRQSTCGGLRRCLLALGKELWLCEEHQSSADYRSKGVAATNAASNKGNAEQTTGFTETTNNPAADITTTNERTKITPQMRPTVDEHATNRASRACVLQ